MIFLCCESINYESENYFDSLVYNDISNYHITVKKHMHNMKQNATEAILYPGFYILYQFDLD